MIRRSYVTVLWNQVRKGRILWPFRQAMKWPALRLGSKIEKPLCGPIHGTFYTTYSCDLRCHFCDLPYRHIEYKKAGRRELGLAEKLQIVEDFASIGTTAIGFTGGEPMLDPDTPALIERAVNLGILTHLSTNGFAFKSGQMTEDLFDLGLHGVSISIDGARRATHNRIRGSKKNYDDVLTSLRNLIAVRKDHANKMSITTTTVITRENYSEIPELVDMLIEMEVDQIGFMPVQDIGLDYDVDRRSRNFMVREAGELDRVVDFLIEKKRKTDRIENTVSYLRLFKKAFRGEPLPIQCYAGYNTLAVDSWGDIYPCFPWAEMRRSAANTRDITLRDFWNTNASIVMRKQASSCRDCFWNNHTELNLMMSTKAVAPPAAYERTSFSLPIPDSVAHHVPTTVEHA
jgi:MoaA/NifB/PqqE/SkfB family radical SAM enzyme